MQPPTTCSGLGLQSLCCLLLHTDQPPSTWALCLHRCLLLRAGYAQLAKFYETPPGSAAALHSHAESANNLSASAFQVPITLHAFPVNRTSKQAAAPSAATPGRRLQEPPELTTGNYFAIACKGPLAPAHAPSKLAKMLVS